MVVAETHLNRPKLILVTGPSRGGKSRWAESLVSDFKNVTYVATSPTREDDEDWQQRIQLHRNRRPPHWTVLESGPQLTQALDQIDSSEQDHAVLIDALGGFVASHLDQDNQNWQQLTDQLSDCLASFERTVVLVVEETGWGVVPPTAIGGLFRDRLGQLGQRFNAQADESWLVVQGRALNLHQLGFPVP